VVGDPGRLRQVLVNLVGNAIKFTEQGEVVVDVSADPADGSGVALKFVVSDTGIGIPQDKQWQIFGPFVQADASTTRRYGGTGLGLTISSQLVELMGGRIWVESEPARGSRFHFVARFELPAAGAIETERRSSETLRDLRVLVVDDNATNRRNLEETLTGWGMRPSTVESAAAALDALAAAVQDRDPFRLVLTDASMPDADGFVLAKSIEADQRFSGVRVILLTSSSALDRPAPCIAARLTKPAKQSDLLDTILALNVPRATSPPDTRSKPAHARGPAAAPKVLVAEDNATNQKLLVTLLEERGYEVAVARTGRDALERLETERFDVVLMDVQMPEMDGLEATAAIRERERATGAHVPIVAMTAHAMTGDRERCLAAGMDGYLAKPLRPAELLAALEAFVPSGAASLPPAGRDGHAPLDGVALLAAFDGNKRLLAEVIDVFLVDAPTMLNAVRQALDRRDGAAVASSAHALKGSVGLFAQAGAYDTARRIEHAGREGRLEEIGALFAALETELAATAVELGALRRGLV
jgi:CheY-like chemotaxis protein/HPt (histidine-containing phosphotransfer) domain-containing protein